MADQYVHFGETNGDGTEGSPFNKLANAVAQVSPGDTIYVRGRTDGQYQKDYLDVSVSGTEGNPITLKGWDAPTKYKITGSDVEENFTYFRDEIWYVATSVTAGTENDKKCTEIVGETETFLTCAGNIDENDEATFTLERGTYSHSSANNGRLYWSPTDGDITGKKLRRQSNQGGLLIRGDWWVIEDAYTYLTGTAAINPQGNNTTIRNCYATRANVAYRVGPMDATGVTGTSVIDCVAERNWSGIRIWGQSDNTLIRGCTIRDNGLPEDGNTKGDRSSIAGGLILNGGKDGPFATNTTIDGCLIERSGWLSGHEEDNELPDPSIIIIYTDGLTIKNTVIQDGARAGIMAGVFSNNVLIENCIINGCNLPMVDWDYLNGGQSNHTNQRGGIAVNRTGNVTIRHTDIYNNLSGRNVSWDATDTRPRGGGVDIRDTTGAEFVDPNDEKVTIEHCRIWNSYDAVEPVGTYDFIQDPVSSSGVEMTWNPAQGSQVGAANARSPQLAVLSVDNDNEIVAGQDDVSIYVRNAGAAPGTVSWGGTPQTVKSWSDHHIVIGPIVDTTVSPGNSAEMTVTKA